MMEKVDRCCKRGNFDTVTGIIGSAELMPNQQMKQVVMTELGLHNQLCGKLDLFLVLQ